MANLVTTIVTKEISEFQFGKGEKSVGQLVDAKIQHFLDDRITVQDVTVHFSEEEWQNMLVSESKAPNFKSKAFAVKS